MKCECIACLCNYCTRSECRYSKARKSDICSVRCIHIDDNIHFNYNPVLVCDKFHHATTHKTYRIKNIRSQKRDTLATISLKDFLKILGGDK